jgi:hypothetical protein
MRHRTLLAMCALLVVSTSGCDKVQSLADKVLKRKPKTTAPAPAPAPAESLTTTPASDAPALPPPAPPPVASRPVQDMPFTSQDTGTINPGMSERDVYSLWGPPVGVRRAGEYTYLFFQNGCEKTCGTLDLVTLQNGQVVDAVVRWPGHGYSGESSSPPGKIPFPTRGGDTLSVPVPTLER